MIKVFIVLISVLLVGCIIKPIHWEAAEEVCESNGGVNYISIGATIRTSNVICLNGGEFSLTRAVYLATKDNDDD